LSKSAPLPEAEDRFLTGAQAAEFLGVKSSTLYAYASRGLIESFPGETARERCYRLTDLIKLRQSTRGYKVGKDQDPAVWTGPAIKSSITDIRPDGHVYRGENAVQLALSGASFESVAELLWETNIEPTIWTKVRPLPVSRQVKALLAADTNYLDIFKLLLVAAEMNDPVSRKLLGDDRFDTARRLIATMAMAPAFPEGTPQYLTQAPYPVAQTLLHALCSSRSSERASVINCALALCADHELNASALAARIAASCDASMYSCLISALGSFSGTLHGSASRRAEDIVTNSLQFKTARAWLKDYLQQFEKIPGFGTELYRTGDPRARVLIETALSVSSKNKHLSRLVEIVECVREHFGAEPNLDVGLAAVSYALSLPPGSGSTMFAVSRTAGWIAHAVEQREYGAIIRPRARYIGKA
jgi:citrate synthase